MRMQSSYDIAQTRKREKEIRVHRFALSGSALRRVHAGQE